MLVYGSAGLFLRRPFGSTRFLGETHRLGSTHCHLSIDLWQKVDHHQRDAWQRGQCHSYIIRLLAPGMELLCSLGFSHRHRGEFPVSAEWECNCCHRTRRQNSSHSSLCCAKAHHCMGKGPFNTMGHKIRSGFLLGVTAALTTLKLTWKTDNPVWVDQ